MSTLSNFSRRLSRLRSHLGETQDQFAQRLGVSRNYVSMLENGREPSEALFKLVKELEEQTPHASIVLREEPPIFRFQPPIPPPSAADVRETLLIRHKLMLERVAEDTEAMLHATDDASRAQLAEMAKMHIDHFLAHFKAL